MKKKTSVDLTTANRTRRRSCKSNYSHSDRFSCDTIWLQCCCESKLFLLFLFGSDQSDPCRTSTSLCSLRRTTQFKVFGGNVWAYKRALYFYLISFDEWEIREWDLFSFSSLRSRAPLCRVVKVSLSRLNFSRLSCSNKQKHFHIFDNRACVQIHGRDI